MEVSKLIQQLPRQIGECPQVRWDPRRGQTEQDLFESHELDVRMHGFAWLLTGIHVVETD